MKPLLRSHVISELTVRRFAWSAAFLLLAACTALVLRILPELGIGASIGLVSCVALGWVVVATQSPRMIVRA